MKITKSTMLDYIESTGMVIAFNRSYLMRRSKDYIVHLYELAQNFEMRQKGE